MLNISSQDHGEYRHNLILKEIGLHQLKKKKTAKIANEYVQQIAIE